MVSERGRKCSKFFCIPQRWILGIMASLGLVNAYTMRISLSIAMTEMIQLSHYNTGKVENTCPKPKESIHTVSNKDDLYDWSDEIQGWILSCFYFGYIITHIPGGVLSELFGGKQVLHLGLLFTALCTLFTPTLLHLTKGNWIWLVVLRVIEGIGEGITFPALTCLLGQWVPLSERSIIGSMVYSGSQTGTIICNLISGGLIKAAHNWEIVFYFFGGLGLVWCLLWQLLCYSSPKVHPFISQKEEDFLEEQLHNVTHGKRKVPWKSMLTSAPVWALVAAQIGHDYGFYTMVTCLPKYLKEVLWFKVEENGLWNSLPYVIMWLVSLASGLLSDYLYKTKRCSIYFLRMFFTTIASVGPAVFIMAASYVGCDYVLAVTMFTIGMAFMGTFYCGMKVNALDLTPSFGGSLMAIVNGMGAITGVITPTIMGYLTKDHTLTQWRIVFWLCFGVFMITNAIYLIWGSAEEQWWNDPNKTGPPPKHHKEQANEGPTN